MVDQTSEKGDISNNSIDIELEVSIHLTKSLIFCQYNDSILLAYSIISQKLYYIPFSYYIKQFCKLIILLLVLILTKKIEILLIERNQSDLNELEDLKIPLKSIQGSFMNERGQRIIKIRRNLISQTNSLLYYDSETDRVIFKTEEIRKSDTPMNRIGVINDEDSEGDEDEDIDLGRGRDQWYSDEGNQTFLFSVIYSIKFEVNSWIVDESTSKFWEFLDRFSFISVQGGGQIVVGRDLYSFNSENVPNSIKNPQFEIILINFNPKNSGRRILTRIKITEVIVGEDSINDHDQKISNFTFLNAAILFNLRQKLLISFNNIVEGPGLLSIDFKMSQNSSNMSSISLSNSSGSIIEEHSIIIQNIIANFTTRGNLNCELLLFGGDRDFHVQQFPLLSNILISIDNFSQNFARVILSSCENNIFWVDFSINNDTLEADLEVSSRVIQRIAKNKNIAGKQIVKWKKDDIQYLYKANTYQNTLYKYTRNRKTKHGITIHKILVIPSPLFYVWTLQGDSSSFKQESHMRKGVNLIKGMIDILAPSSYSSISPSS